MILWWLTVRSLSILMRFVLTVVKRRNERLMNDQRCSAFSNGSSIKEIYPWMRDNRMSAKRATVHHPYQMQQVSQIQVQVQQQQQPQPQITYHGLQLTECPNTLQLSPHPQQQTPPISLSPGNDQTWYFNNFEIIFKPGTRQSSSALLGEYANSAKVLLKQR